MSKVLKEVTATIGTYTNAQGEQKYRYQRIGSVIQTKNGPMLKLDVVPLKEGGWDGWAYLNDPKPKDDAPQMSARPSRDFDDEVPF
jgi:hypothetical protein